MTSPSQVPARKRPDPPRPEQRGSGAPRISRCGGCSGYAAPAPGAPAPLGWLSISVSVPAEISRRPGKRHQFVGQYCCVGCMVADAGRLADKERKARESYEAAPAEHPRRPAGDDYRALMTERPGVRR